MPSRNYISKNNNTIINNAEHCNLSTMQNTISFGSSISLPPVASRESFIYSNRQCKRCNSSLIGDNGRGENVCYSCGRIFETQFEGEVEFTSIGKKTYKRIFYFNERCSRWCCNEPKISKDVRRLIKEEARRPTYGSEYNRSTISKILRNIKLTEKFQKKHQSKKFKRTLLTPKRFYDKYFEKWKSIRKMILKKELKIPPDGLVQRIKQLFVACQIPFELYRHAENCDGRYQCDKYFPCWHNFINYDFTFRKLLQIAELKYGWNGCYDRFKDEFPLVSEKIRDNKLRPMFLKIAVYNNWPCVNNE